MEKLSSPGPRIMESPLLLCVMCMLAYGEECACVFPTNENRFTADVTLHPRFRGSVPGQPVAHHIPARCIPTASLPRPLRSAIPAGCVCWSQRLPAGWLGSRALPGSPAIGRDRVTLLHRLPSPPHSSNALRLCLLVPCALVVNT